MLEELGVLVKYLLQAIPEVIIVMICIQYIRKVSSLDGKLLLAGSVLGLLNLTFFSFYYQYFFHFEESQEPYFIVLNNVNRIVNLIASILFAFGFILLVHKYLVLKKKQ